jgi:hypothetical protein
MLAQHARALQRQAARLPCRKLRRAACTTPPAPSTSHASARAVAARASFCSTRFSAHASQSRNRGRSYDAAFRPAGCPSRFFRGGRSLGSRSRAGALLHRTHTPRAMQSSVATLFLMRSTSAHAAHVSSHNRRGAPHAHRFCRFSMPRFLRARLVCLSAQSAQLRKPNFTGCGVRLVHRPPRHWTHRPAARCAACCSLLSDIGRICARLRDCKPLVMVGT